jgi:hypothetical protein
VRRRRDVPLFPLLIPPVIVLVIVVGGYASTRFRSPAEVVLCVLTAVALDGGFDAVQRWRSPGVSPVVESRHGELARGWREHGTGVESDGPDVVDPGSRFESLPTIES